MSGCLFGVEWESALVALGRGGGPVDRGSLLDLIMSLARRRLPHLPGSGESGLWLPNGSRFYVDCSSHPEFTTPECSDPGEIVRYLQVAERTLAGLAAEVAAGRLDVTELLVLRSNVDYTTRATWGCHENYLHRAEPRVVHRELIPHLVSRLVYCGAGGFNPLSPGIEFTLSPRVWHLVTVQGPSSTSSRPLVHTKDESLSRSGYHRLHLICGDTLCSQTATWLKVGTTALIVLMVDNGLHPGRGVQLPHPLRALRTFARDPHCRARVRLMNRERATAIAIQQRYLACAETHLRAPFMPGWAEEVCAEWRRTLDALAEPESLSARLDWCIKRALYEDHVRRRGFEWKTLRVWNRTVSGLLAGVRGTALADRPLRAETLLGPRSPIPDTLAKLAPLLQRSGLDWAGLRPFLDLRKELLEIDTRFGQVDDRGIFASMDRAGALSHRVPGVENIEGALTTPPAHGRARVRGTVVGRHAGDKGFCCDWQRVFDLRGRRVLDLSDPFASEERWAEMSTETSVLMGLRDAF